jgi:hypothetical protein
MTADAYALHMGLQMVVASRFLGRNIGRRDQETAQPSATRDCMLERRAAAAASTLACEDFIGAALACLISGLKTSCRRLGLRNNKRISHGHQEAAEREVRTLRPRRLAQIHGKYGRVPRGEHGRSW